MKSEIGKKALKATFRKIFYLAVILTIAIPLHGFLMAGELDVSAADLGVEEVFVEVFDHIIYCDDIVEDTFYIDINKRYGEALNHYIQETRVLIVDDGSTEGLDYIIEIRHLQINGAVGNHDYIIKEVSPFVIHADYEYIHHEMITVFGL